MHNNHVEGWHSRLKKVVGKPHPNIYEIIDVFKREEVSTKVKMYMLEAGAQSLNDYLEAMKYNTGLCD